MPVIAIDGPAASGKGTIARGLAERYGFAYLDTGLLYRALGAKLGLSGASDPAPDPAVAAAAAAALADADFAQEGLRSAEAGAAASIVAAIPEVRRALFDYQRGFASGPPAGANGAVLDGRDIGTVVFPDADAKLFVTASVEERARRRALELLGEDSGPGYAAVMADLVDRDRRDANRAHAPMRAAEDAAHLDTDALDAAASVARAIQLVEAQAPGLAALVRG